MSKDTINIKSNGIRNELKEIRKSIDNLTNAILMAQTHTHHDKNINLPISSYPTNGVRWNSTQDTRDEQTEV